MLLWESNVWRARVAENTNEASLACLPLTSSCVPLFLTGRRLVPVHGPGVGELCLGRQKTQTFPRANTSFQLTENHLGKWWFNFAVGFDRMFYITLKLLAEAAVSLKNAGFVPTSLWSVRKKQKKKGIRDVLFPVWWF